MILVNLSGATSILIIPFCISSIFQVHNSIDVSHDNFQSKLNLQQISSQLHEVLRVDSLEHFNESKVC